MVRFKNRYILFQLHWKDGKIDDSLDEPALLAVFRESIRQNFGDFGLGGALVSFQVKYYNRWTNMCLVRCSRDQYRQIWCALTLITEIQNRVVSIRMVNITGTAKKSADIVRQVEEFAVKRLSVSSEQQQQILDAAILKLQAVDV